MDGLSREQQVQFNSDEMYHMHVLKFQNKNPKTLTQYTPTCHMHLTVFSFSSGIIKVLISLVQIWVYLFLLV